MKQRLAFTVTLEVDPVAWADEYEVDLEQVPRDVRSYIDSLIQCSIGADFFSAVEVTLP